MQANGIKYMYWSNSRTRVMRKVVLGGWDGLTSSTLIFPIISPFVPPCTPSITSKFPPTPDTSLQLRRDVIFCQAATGALCTLAEQLLAALRSRFNNAGEYQEDGKETSRKWLEQISVIGMLLHFQSTLAPHLVRFSVFIWQEGADRWVFSVM